MAEATGGAGSPAAPGGKTWREDFRCPDCMAPVTSYDLIGRTGTGVEEWVAICPDCTRWWLVRSAPDREPKRLLWDSGRWDRTQSRAANLRQGNRPPPKGRRAPRR